MRKIIISFISITLAYAAYGQTISLPDNASSSSPVSKHGALILPEEGDVALGFDALPVINFLGNIFNGDVGNSLSLNSQTIYGRYFLSSDVALRVNLMVNNGTNTVKWFVQDDAAVLADPLSQKNLIDKRINKFSSWMVTTGIQKYRGYGRLKGFYGATVGYGQSRSMFEYQYGNQITEANQTPTSITNFGSGTSGNPAQRDVKDDNGLTRNINLGPVCGVEFYFAPKMCIGAEASVIFNVDITTESDHTYEQWVNGEVRESNIEDNPGDLDRGVFSSGLGAYGGLYFMFHF